jgi:excisionase family DNA binding protein
MGKIMSETFYTVSEVAEHLKVSVPAVYKWIDQGKIEVVRMGRSVRISQTALDRFIAERTERSIKPTEIVSSTVSSFR